jgi:phosphoenolpyruvate carboxykinase (ATP)
MITAALTGELDKVEYRHDELFNLDIPTSVDGVPPEILDPKNTWNDKDFYEKSAKSLSKMFVENFEKFSDISPEIKNAGPKFV